MYVLYLYYNYLKGFLSVLLVKNYTYIGLSSKINQQIEKMLLVIENSHSGC